MSSKLLVVIGCLEDEDHIKKLVKNVLTGIESWIAPLPLDDQEELVQTLNNIPSMKSIPNRNADYGTVVSRYRGRILDSTVLINPTSENLNDELIDLFLTAPPKCLIGYGGFVTEDNADWILQDGIFSFNNFRHIFKDSKVIAALSEHNTKVTISCCKLGLWRTTEGVFEPESKITLEIMDSQPTFEQSCDGDHLKGTESKNQSAMEEFSSFLEDGIGNEIGGIFNTLKPPLQEGFLKIRNPCLYIFPSGNGDSAFFAVNGYNMLVNGGSCSKSSFWKLVQHVDRVDSILVTHLGSDNLPGINSLLLRKLQERQVKLPMDNTTPEYQEMRRCLISPDIGPIFINAPTKFMESVIKSSSTDGSNKTDTNTNGASSSPDDAVSKHPIQKTTDIVRDTLRLSKALNMELDPLVRKPAAIEPMTLFLKHGLGRLEMYVISPAEGSKELGYVNEKWGSNGKTTPTGKTGIPDSTGQEGDSSVTNLSSICALLVWHPSSPHEKIVRVLFPGNATQTKIFEGLESLKNVAFLKAQYMTKNILNKQKHSAKPDGTHVTQKPTRSVNAANIGKKPVSATAPKKVTSATNAAFAKNETSTAAKVTDKRSKAERGASARTKPATASATNVAKNVTAKERATLKSANTDLEKSSKTSAPKKLSSRPTSTVHPKPDTKRPSAVTASKAPAAKTKPHSAPPAKTIEKPKKSQTLASKQKTEPHKTTPKRSTKPPVKKGTPVGKMATDKAKKEKAVPAKAVTTPPEDLTAAFVEFEAAKDKQAKPTELPSTGSEEPTTSILSDRHSPEGEDGSTIQYAESSSVAMNDKSESAKDDSKHFREYEDTGFIIMNKPEISEDSDMISTDGSSAVMQQQASMDDNTILIGQVLTQEELISSDKSSPEEMSEPEKVVKFSEPEEDEQKSHKPVERLPTPFQSLQESSSTNEMSPVSELESTSAVEAQVPNQTKIESESPEEDKKQANLTPTGHNKETAGTVVTLPVQSPDPPREMGSEVHSPFNSSAEGSYELYPTGRSPPPASTQETIAETISDFKHDDIDEPPAVAELEEPRTYLDTQPEQTELLEDPTISTEVPDIRCSMSTTSTGSQFARIDPPFSSSEAGLSSVAKDPSLAIQAEHADSRDQDEVVDEDEMPEVDQDVAQGMEKGDVVTEHPEAEDVKTEDVEHENEEHAEVAASEPEVIQGEPDDVDENLYVEEYKYSHCEDLKPTELENCPQQVWGVQDKDVNADAGEEELHGQEEEELHGQEEEKLHEEEEVIEKKELNLHASQHQDDEEQRQAGEDFDEHRVMDADQRNVLEKEELDLHASQHQDNEEQRDAGEDFDEHRVINTDVQAQHHSIGFGMDSAQSTECMKEREEQGDFIQMTGSLVSSAQDQEPDDESEATSLTESADASESNPPPQPQVEFVDDGPDLKEYEHVDMGSIPKSDLVLASTEENFALHGGPTTEGVLLGCGDEAQQNQSACDPDMLAQESDQHTDLWQDQGEIPKMAPRYHPSYLDTFAPLANTKEVHTGIDQLKDGDLDSPLDVNARPFLPKSSVPVHQSPTYGDEALFVEEDSLFGHVVFEEFGEPAPTLPPGSNNPFLVDLIASNQQNPVNLEEPCPPPTKGPDPCAAQGKTTKSAVKKPGAAAARKSAVLPIYVDLAYVPNHGNKNTVGTEFFKKIRAKYYVLSGNDPSRLEPSAEVLNHLLEGRRTWLSEPSTSTSDHEDTNVTVIATHNSHAVKAWYKQNFKELESCNIHMVASGSKVMVQVDSIEACKIEF